MMKNKPLSAQCALGLACILLASLLASCDDSSSSATYPDPQTSPYILPYLPGSTFKVSQGNDMPRRNPWMHHGNCKFAYDWDMPIGTPIIAARAGKVIFVRDQFRDDQHAMEQGNALVILHDDGTVALYGHMTFRGVHVRLGDRVAQGDRIATSGNSGMSVHPHLHFQVNQCADFNACASIPISFRNAIPSATQLRHGDGYEAGPIRSGGGEN